MAKENTKTAEEIILNEIIESYPEAKGFSGAQLIVLKNIANEYSHQREQQEAISFAEWVDESGYVDSSDYDPKNETEKRWQLLNPNPPPYHGTLDCETENWEAMIGERLTSEQLYTIFRQEKENRK